MKATEAFRFALHRALAVFWGGVVAAGLYLCIVLIGPNLEGRFFPVVTTYQLSEFRTELDGGVSFVSRFYKARDCAYYGATWYATDAQGNFIRLQLNPVGREQQPPTTGPLGWRVGQRSELHPPAGATKLLITMQHDCGLVWQTRTTLGPFSLDDGHALSAEEGGSPPAIPPKSPPPVPPLAGREPTP